MQIKPEKGIPMPDGITNRRGRSKTHNAKYPWDEMEVGDSFPVPHHPPSGAHGMAATRNKKEGYRKFAAATINGEPRIWRIA